MTSRQRRFSLEQKWEALLRAFPDVGFIIDADGQYVEIISSPRTTSLLYDAPEKLRGSYLSDVLPADKADRFLSIVQTTLAENSVQTVEYSLPVQRGVRWFEGHVAPIPTDEGQSECVLLVAQDITARKRREQELQIGEYAIDSAPGGIAVADLDYELISVNPAFLEMWGYGEQSDVLGKPVVEFWESADEAEQVVADLREREESSGELRAVRADGSSFLAQYSASVVTDESGEPIAMMASFVDVTERREREAELHELRRQYETVFENTQDALFLVDVGDDGVFRYVQCNEVGREVLGRMCDDIEGKTPREILGESVGVKVEERYRECLDERQTITYETELPLPDRTRVWQTQLTPVVIDGEVTKLVGAARDITELREYEQRLESQRDQLELLNRIVRHDIRNDMQVVLGFAEMLRTEAPQEHRDDIGRIVETSRHTVELTKTARDLVEMIGAEEEPETRPVNVATALLDEFENTQRSYPDATFDIDEKIPTVKVRANGFLPAVFRNLLHNAVQHNDKSEPHVEVHVSVRDETVAVEIADNGPGIPDRQKADIFEKGDAGLEGSETGMGLYFVETLVQRYGGDVSVEDNESEGSVFTVELPRADT